MIVGNAHHIKNVPGRKTDVKDSEWIADLVRHGLIRPSYVPARRSARGSALRETTGHQAELGGARAARARPFPERSRF